VTFRPMGDRNDVRVNGGFSGVAYLNPHEKSAVLAMDPCPACGEVYDVRDERFTCAGCRREKEQGNAKKRNRGKGYDDHYERRILELASEGRGVSSLYVVLCREHAESLESELDIAERLKFEGTDARETARRVTDHPPPTRREVMVTLDRHRALTTDAWGVLTVSKHAAKRALRGLE
jgi:hypothetical protein